MKKRIVTLLLATVMGLSLVGCGAANNATAPETNQTTSDSIADADSDVNADIDNIVDEIVDEITTDDSTGSDTTVSTEDMSIANSLLNDFSDIVNAGEATSALEIAEALSNSPVIEFGPATMELEPGYLAGFTEEISGFDEGAFFGPMIGSIPFVGYVFTVSGDADAFLDQITSVSDPRWNICTEADETVGLVVGDKVCFIMSPLSFDEM